MKKTLPNKNSKSLGTSVDVIIEEGQGSKAAPILETIEEDGVGVGGSDGEESDESENTDDESSDEDEDEEKEKDREQEKDKDGEQEKDDKDEDQDNEKDETDDYTTASDDDTITSESLPSKEHKNDKTLDNKTSTDTTDVNEFFKIPIYYDTERACLESHITADLELIDAVDVDAKPLYEHIFQPTTPNGKRVMKQFAKHYTTNKAFLIDTQTILKSVDYDALNAPDNLVDIISEWNSLRVIKGFKEKYNYIDWEPFEFVNNSEPFLQLKSLYSIASPFISLVMPILMLALPFFILKLRGLPLSIGEYVRVLRNIASNNAVMNLFTNFSGASNQTKIYLLLTTALYLFSVYQNVIACKKFHTNMAEIHKLVEKLKIYIRGALQSLDHVSSMCAQLKTHVQFATETVKHQDTLQIMASELDRISTYSFSIKKFTEFGTIWKCFYDLHQNVKYHNAMMYSFGVYGYLENIIGLGKNIHSGAVRFPRFVTSNKNSKMENMTYPCLTAAVKNSYDFTNNTIISGPNASGKTTMLKTVLLNVIMTQQVGCGYYESASLAPFSFIHCYLNIPDTSGRDSLFQAEARRCKDILDVIHACPSPKSTMHFCAFDELYSGTNPDEAVLSAFAFIRYLKKYSGVSFIMTTHFVKLCKKLRAEANISNCKMSTSQSGNDFSYMYKMIPGISKVKGGVKVLSDMEYPKEIVDESRHKKQRDSVRKIAQHAAI